MITEYILVLITMTVMNGPISTQIDDPFDDIIQCMEARENLVNRIGRPVINYQAICVTKKVSKL